MNQDVPNTYEVGYEAGPIKRARPEWVDNLLFLLVLIGAVLFFVWLGTAAL